MAAAAGGASGAAGSPEANVRVVQGYLSTLQAIGNSSFPHFSPDLRVHSNGRVMDLAAFRQHYLHLAGELAEARFQVLDIFGRRDRVAVWRRVSPLATKDGTQQPAAVIVEVWTVRGGLIVAGEQCWQRVAGPAADDIPISPRESLAGEAVRAALMGLQDLAGIQDHVLPVVSSFEREPSCPSFSLAPNMVLPQDLAGIQDHVRKYWAPTFRGCIDGVQLDLPALARHWAHLQSEFSTVIVDIKEAAVHASSPAATASSVGVVYHLLVGRRDRHLAELRMLSVYSVNADDKIVGVEAVSRLLSGDAGDELLAVMGLI